MSHPLTTVTVRVPGSTSNCGSGFDTLGLALDHLFALARERGLDVDLHVDQTDDLTAFTELQFADVKAQYYTNLPRSQAAGVGRYCGPHVFLRLGGVAKCQVQIRSSGE